MDGNWDGSLVDPTDSPVDAVFSRTPLSSVGGKIGPLTVENGAKLSFPWKAQQVTGLSSYSGEIYIGDQSTNDGGNPTVDGSLIINGPLGKSSATQRSSIKLRGNSFPISAYSTSLTLSAGGTSWTGDTNSIYVGGSSYSNYGVLSYVDTILLTAGRIKNSGITQILPTTTSAKKWSSFSGNPGFVNALNSPLSIWTDGYDVAVPSSGSFSLALGADYVAANNDNAFNIHSYELPSIGSTYTPRPINLNQLHNGAVRANGYPLVPLLNAENPLAGSLPSIGANAPGFKYIAGRQSVLFASGVGTLTFPAPTFPTGILCVLVTSEYAKQVVSLTSATVSSAVFYSEVPDFNNVVGGLASGYAVLNYIAIGW